MADIMYTLCIFRRMSIHLDIIVAFTRFPILFTLAIFTKGHGTRKYDGTCELKGITFTTIKHQ